MRKIVLTTIFLMLSAGLMFGQGELNDIAQHDRLTYDPADSTRPWHNDNGVRSVVVTNDLDGDGKAEVIATDYTNGGRVHVMEYNDGVLEIVWSSPIQYDDNPSSTPRWVQYGDMDGDGNGEIIFPVGPSSSGEIQVWENVGDDDYGEDPAITMSLDQFTTDGVGVFSTSRERATVYDFDGDGMDELITSNNDDQAVYVLTVSADIPGPFSSFEIEGGHPDDVDTNAFSGGSWWHSIPADINGDGDLEIVNHYWNYFGFWSLEVNGPDDYTYPSNGNPDGGVHGPVYYEYFKDEDEDLVSYRGIAAADVDGDGKDEIVGNTGFSGDFAHGVAILSLPEGDEGIEVWTEDVFSYLVSSEEIDFGGTAIDHWSIHAADLNQNGKDEILVGGSYNENVVSLEYTGSGDVGDLASYDMENWFPGPQQSLKQQSTYITVRDSAGVVDTVYPDAAWTSPVVMTLSDGDVTGDGNPELAIGYQSNGYDSVTVYHEVWQDTAFVGTDTTKIQMDPQVNVRVLSSTATGLKELTNEVVTPDDYKLGQNYPNPFNPTTTIRFALPVNKQISLVVYDVLGREVKTLIDNEAMKKGSYEVTWDGTNNFGNEVASGTYIYRLEYGNFSKSKKMIFMK